MCIIIFLLTYYLKFLWCSPKGRGGLCKKNEQGLVLFLTHLFELRGEALVLLRQRGDQEALLLLRLPLLVAVLVELRLQVLQVLLQLAHLQVVLLLDGVEPPPQVVLLLLQFLKRIRKNYITLVSRYGAMITRSLISIPDFG